jgi:hypothetical protein
VKRNPVPISLPGVPETEVEVVVTDPTVLTIDVKTKI